MSFRFIWPASSDVGAVTGVSLLRKSTSSPMADIFLKVLSRDSYDAATQIRVDLRFTAGTYTRSNPPNIFSNGIKVVTCRSVYPDYLTELALLISSDAYEIVSVGSGSNSTGILIQPPTEYIHTGSSGVIVAPNPVPDMSQYLKSSDVEILKTRLLALKTEFARLENKWSRLDTFASDLMHFNSILDGYKNTIPPESYVKLSSVVEKLKAALK